MSLILEAIQQYYVADKIDGQVGYACDGSKFHSPTPLSVQQVDLTALVEPLPGVPDQVSLCGVCQNNLRVFVVLMVASDGDLGWAIRREFGNRIRDLGTKAWGYYKESQRG